MTAKTKPTTYTHPSAMPDELRAEYEREWQALEDAYCKAMKPYDAALTRANRLWDKAKHNPGYLTRSCEAAIRKFNKARQAKDEAINEHGATFKAGEAALRAKYHIVEVSFIPR